MTRPLAIAVLVLAAATAHAAKPVPLADARELMKMMDVLSTANLDEAAERTLEIQGCSELPSCAGACAATFHAYLEASPLERGAILSRCPAARDYVAKNAGVANVVQKFFHDFLVGFAGRARLVLKGEERARFDALAKKVKLDK